MKNLIQRFIREEEGQDLVEYAFLIVFIALAITVVLTNTETAISNVFGTISTRVNAS